MKSKRFTPEEARRWLEKIQAARKELRTVEQGLVDRMAESLKRDWDKKSK
jgi:hypothetical protein